jgi:anaerobic selenocysteine-containing dehydrogenase
MSGNMLNHRFTRRAFLKATAATAAVATIGAKFEQGSFSTLPSRAKSAVTSKEQFVLCRMCHAYFCGARVKVEGGVVTQVEGDKACPVNQGAFCIRGQGMVMNLYEPYRIKSPMKRTNPEKGLDIDPGWVEISWDEAFSTLAGRLKKIRAEDPRKLAFCTGFGADANLMATSFAAAFGTPNRLGATGAMCSTHFHNFLGHGTMMDRTDVEFCEYLIAVGRGTGANFGEAQGTVWPFTKARERGMKFVVVDPRNSPEAAKADEWVPIRTGTDHAFFLALQNVIIHERNTFDRDFVKWRSNGAYLIGPDELYVNVNGKPAIWDASDNQAKAFNDPGLKDPAIEGTFIVAGVTAKPAFQLLKDMVAKSTPEWAEQITTVPAATIRRIANEFIDHAHIGSKIQLDGVTLPFRPVAINVNRGVTNRKNGHLASFAAVTTCMLMGAMDAPGSRLGTGFGANVTPPDAEGTLAIPAGTGLSPGPYPWKYPPDSYDASELYPHRHSVGFIAMSAILDPAKYGLKYTLDTMIFYGHNYYTKGGDPATITAALKKLPFIATIAFVMDENAMLSDMLLPENAMLERLLVNINPPGSTEMRPKLVDRSNIALTGTIVGLPAVDRLYNTMEADDIALELADRLGILKGEGGINGIFNRNLVADQKIDVSKRYEYKDMVDRRLKSVNGADKGLSWFAQNGFNMQTAPLGKAYNSGYHPETRYNLYRIFLKRSELSLRKNWASVGVPMPGWDLNDFLSYYRPLTEYRLGNAATAPAEFDMWASVWRTPPFMFDISGVQSNALLYDVAKTWDRFAFHVLINSKTAAARGLKDEDQIWVESPYSKTLARVRVTETIHPDVVGFHGGLQRLSKGLNPIAREGASFNRLVPITEGTFEPITGALDTAVKVKIYKA